MSHLFIPEKITRENNNFDFLRLMGAFLVFFGHSILITHTSTFTISTGLSIGALGVNIFFIISGFLITKSWIESSNTIIFIKKRVLRIYPALIFVIFFTVFLIGPFTTFLSFGNYFRSPIVLNYLNNIFLIKLINVSNNVLPGVFVFNKIPFIVNAPLWTIPIETGCYILVMIFGLNRLLKKRMLLFLTFLCLLIYSVILTLNKDFQIYFQNYFQIPYLDIIRLLTYFFSGIVLYLYREVLTIDKKYLYASLLILIGSIWLNYFELLSYFLLPILVLFIAFFKTELSKRITRYGDFSYGFYLFAFPIQQTIAYLFKGNISLLQHLLISFPPTLFLAVLSWNLIEKPFLKLKEINIAEKLIAVCAKK